MVIAGEMCIESAMVFAEYAKKIPPQNITGLSRHISTRCYNTILGSLKVTEVLFKNYKTKIQTN